MTCVRTARHFCFSMSFVSSANLPSYFRGNPGNRRDRPTSFGLDVFMRRILNKRSNQDKYCDEAKMRTRQKLVESIYLILLAK